MKLPTIPLPEPTFMIDVTHGNDRQRRNMVNALRILLWVVPAAAVDYVLATVDWGRHSLWLTLAATYITLALAVLTVGVRDGGSEEES